MAGGRPGTDGKEPGWDPRYTVKDGFFMDCGLPTVLLSFKRSQGPWSVQHKGRKIEVIRDSGVVAWSGLPSHVGEAQTLCEKLNGYELAREFPPAGQKRDWTTVLKRTTY